MTSQLPQVKKWQTLVNTTARRGERADECIVREGVHVCPWLLPLSNYINFKVVLSTNSPWSITALLRVASVRGGGKYGGRLPVCPARLCASPAGFKPLGAAPPPPAPPFPAGA